MWAQSHFVRRHKLDRSPPKDFDTFSSTNEAIMQTVLNSHQVVPSANSVVQGLLDKMPNGYPRPA